MAEETAISPAQMRAARGLLGWNLQQLSEAAQVSIDSINKYEKGHTAMRRSAIAAVRRAFEAAGVEFTNGDGAGVRLRK
jgi:transcriptional regulator with XRE-family HTH domain